MAKRNALQDAEQAVLNCTRAVEEVKADATTPVLVVAEYETALARAKDRLARLRPED